MFHSDKIINLMIVVAKRKKKKKKNQHREPESTDAVVTDILLTLART